MPPPKPTFFHGSKNVASDARYTASHKATLKNLKCPPVLSKPSPLGVQFDIESVSKYVYEELEKVLGMEDEVLGDMLINMLFTQPTTKPKPNHYGGKEVAVTGVQLDKNVDPKEVQLFLNDFLGMQRAYTFMEELWSKLIGDVFVFKEREQSRGGRDDKAKDRHATSNDFRHSAPLSPNSDHARRTSNNYHSRRRYF